MVQKVTILGAGNGGLTTAFHLASLGVQVKLWAHPDHSKSLEGVKNKGGIEALKSFSKDGIEIEGKLSGFVKLEGITTNIEEAVNFSDLLLLILPSFSHEKVFRSALPYLKSGQTIVIIPGNFSSLVFGKIMKESGISKDINFIETNSLPYGCRIMGEGQIMVIMIRKMLKLASFPGNKLNQTLKTLEKIFPIEMRPRKNILEATFANPNLITHSVTAILNMGWIESGEGVFHFYKEGMSESISRAIQKIDDERITIGKAFNLSLIPYIEVISSAQGKNYSSLHDYVISNPLKATIGYNNPTGPKDRYITEDTPYLMVPIHELGKLAEKPHPTIESIIHLAGVFNDLDFYKIGLTLDKMGLAGMSPGKIEKYLESGSNT